MRTHQHHHHHYHHHKLLVSLITSLNCLIIFDALLLNAQQPTGDGVESCYASRNTTCSAINLTTTRSFPFITSDECGTTSSLVLSGCMPRPQWPHFNETTNSSNLSSPTVTGFYNPPYNASNSSPQSINRFEKGYGFINLTWNESLIKQPGCTSPISLDQISGSIPESIDLQSFAFSSFQFSLSNIILLFNCNSTTTVNSSAYKDVLQKNTSACRIYGVDCNLQEEKDYSCYQYKPYKNLSLHDAMRSLDCKKAMFFAVPNILINASRWLPGTIELNWSTTGNNTWLASALERCAGCLYTNGTCGYDSSNQFRCFCAHSQFSSTNCSAPSRVCNHSLCWPHLKIIIGVAGSAIALSILLALLALLCFCNRKKVSKKADVPCSSPHSWMKRPSFLSRKQEPISVKEFPYQDLVLATDFFAEKHILGDGGFGAVYKGVLADGSQVAIKRLHHDNYRRMEHFYNEIKVLSTLNHPNLVKLYGFCCEDERELLLVFEYASQGTVSDQLHNSSQPPMSWKCRLDIACETADALSYLHNSLNPPIYHRDVKTTNILLDEGYHAKLGDFGLSKFVPLKASHVSTAPQGTPGYLDPQYHHCYQLTDKSDVYSLGVVLMELISGQLAVDMSREKGEINLSTLAVMKIKCGLSEELVDPTLKMKENASVEKSIERVIELAFQCLQAERDERPPMSSVVETLAKIRRETAAGDEKLPLNTHIPTPTHSHMQSSVSDGPNKPSPPTPHHSSQSVFFSSDSYSST